MANEIKVLQLGKNRLFEPMHSMLLVTDSFGVSIMYALLNRIEIAPSQSHATSRSKQFDITVRFPLLTCLRASATGRPLSEIAFAYTDGRAPDPVPPGKTQTTVKGSGMLTLKALTPIYVDFYEKHRRWIRGTFGGDSYAWPPLFNFARAFRNFISHHDGHVHFDNQNAKPVFWHNLQYSPADEGKRVIPDDIDMADLFILMFELGEELDRRGCPFNP